jgi:hypothetical protein
MSRTEYCISSPAPASMSPGRAAYDRELNSSSASSVLSSAVKADVRRALRRLRPAPTLTNSQLPFTNTMTTSDSLNQTSMSTISHTDDVISRTHDVHHESLDWSIGSSEPGPSSTSTQPSSQSMPKSVSTPTSASQKPTRKLDFESRNIARCVTLATPQPAPHAVFLTTKPASPTPSAATVPVSVACG